MLMRRISFLLIAMMISIGTIFAAHSWMQTQLASRKAAPAPAPIEAPKQLVLVAKTDLAAGQFVRPENLRWQAWPDGAVAANYVVEGKGKLEDFVGAVVRSGIMAGEPIVNGRVVRPGDRGFMAAVLLPGTRAVTVPVTPSSGIAGFVFPGDHVDVILTLTIAPGQGRDGQRDGVERRASETVLSNIRVLAVDQRADDQKHEVAVAKTATLEVTPKQAEIVAVASEMGKLSLSLRSLAQGSDKIAADSHTWDSDAAPILKIAPKAATLMSVRKVSVVRGAEAKDVQFGSLTAQ